MIKRIQLNIPVADAEAKAQGMADGTSQLIIELNDGAEPPSIVHNLKRVFGSDLPMAAIFINPFRTVRIDSAESTVLAGFDCVLVGTGDLIAVLQVPCEQLILFAANEARVAHLRTRLDEHEPRWWHLSHQNLIGALTHAKDLINPIVVYESTNNVLDILGDEEIIRSVFARIA